MIGDVPDVDAFRYHVDWSEGMIRLTYGYGYGSTELADLVSDLHRQPERLARIPCNNLTNDLLLHHWLHRWRCVLDADGLSVGRGVEQRERRLLDIAAR